MHSFRNRLRPLALATTLAMAVVAVSACGENEGEPARQPGELEVAATPTEIVDPTAENAAQAPEAEDVDPGFDIESVPVSEAPLGAFPYFSLPDGYHNPNRDIPIVDLDRVPFWTGDRLEWVEGRVFQTLVHAERGKSFSLLELERNIHRLVESVGGVKVTGSRIPREFRNSIDSDLQVRYVSGFGSTSNAPVHTYLVRRPDRDIWIHLAGNTASGGMLVAETEAFVPTATLLPASELKQELDDTGKVALHINFATDEAEILPDSRPQIEQVLTLLQASPELRLAVDGHTDDTGEAGHNRRLSEARAAAVVAVLTAEGIGPDRLQARGYGPDQPVADNATEDGRATNRRVELVRL